MIKRFCIYINNLSAASRKLLFVCVPMIVGSLLWVFAAFACELKADPLYACLVYPKYFEHIMISLALTVGGAVLFDINEKY